MKYIFIILILLFCSSLNAQVVQNYNVDSYEKSLLEVRKYLDKKDVNGAVRYLDNVLAIRNQDLSLDLEEYVILSRLLLNICIKYKMLEEAEERSNVLVDLLKGDYENSSHYRNILVARGMIYVALNNYAKAKRDFAKAKFLFEKNLDMGVDYARCLANNAVVYGYDGNNLLAKLCLDEAEEILSNFDNTEVDMAVILSSMSVAYEKLGYIDEAIDLAKRSIDIICVNTGRLTEFQGWVSLNNLGCLYIVNKNFNDAVDCFQKAYSCCPKYERKDELGLNWALALSPMSATRSAKVALLVSEQIQQDVINKFLFLSNEEREIYWRDLEWSLSKANAFICNARENSYLGEIYNNTLFSKGLLLRTCNLIKEKIYASGNEKIIALFEELLGYQSKLYDQVIPSDSIYVLENMINRIDKELTKEVTSFDLLRSNFDWKDIRKELRRDEIAIEFIRLPQISIDSLVGNYTYYALLLRRDYKYPKIIQLSREQELLDLIQNTNQQSSERFIKNLYSNGNPRFTKGAKLYKLLWKPIEHELENVRKIYYSPVGLLNTIALHALNSDSLYLFEKYDMKQLSSTYEIIRLKHKTKEDIINAAVYGGIHYDVPKEELLMAANGYEHHVVVNRNWEQEERRYRNGWHYLQGTLVEANDVTSWLEKAGVSVELYKGVEANEESFKALDGKSISLIHVATHGFFLSDAKEMALNPFMRQLNSSIKENNLLLRSGLLFAGANRAWINEDVVDNIDDGILTADEISRMDLSQTDLVVLSACETGLGEIVSIEGVYGLQRAFKLAGVQGLIMSLWKVPDEATSMLMSLFYRNWFQCKDRYVAFKEAQKQVKEKYPSPYYWAGFVMLD